MAVGLARNAQAALELIDPSAPECLNRAGAVRMTGVRFSLAQGEGAGNIADEVDEIEQGKRLTSIVHRAALLQELLDGVPENRMHASKKLQKVDHDSFVTLYFTDGTTHECDILVGADGIHSTVRKLVLGENDPAASPRNSGTWLLMTLQPIDKAQVTMVKELVDIQDAREYGWAGENSFLMHNILSGGQLVQFAIASHDKEVDSALLNRWHRNVGAEEIKTLFQAWPPHLKRAVNEVRLHASSSRIWG
jgi:salicylate hydroxylase